MHPRGTRSRDLMHSRVQSLECNVLKSNNLLNFTYYNESSERTQTDAPKQWQEHTKCSSPPLSNPTKPTKAMEEYERKNKEKYQELQDLDPQGSPHLEEIWLGGECRS